MKLKIEGGRSPKDHVISFFWPSALLQVAGERGDRRETEMGFRVRGRRESVKRSEEEEKNENEGRGPMF